PWVTVLLAVSVPFGADQSVVGRSNPRIFCCSSVRSSVTPLTCSWGESVEQATASTAMLRAAQRFRTPRDASPAQAVFNNIANPSASRWRAHYKSYSVTVEIQSCAHEHLIRTSRTLLRH